MQNLRPYCDVVIYLLLVSYSAMLGEKVLHDIYYSIAHTAQVMNASSNFGSNTGHHHSQELALLALDAIQEAQAGEVPNSQEENGQKPDQQLKYFNDFPANPELFIGRNHIPTASIAHCFPVYPRTSSPPPRVRFS